MIKNAWLSFSRNGWLSAATVLILTLTLVVIGGLIILGVVSQVVIKDLENKIDIAVYFLPNAAENDILNIKTVLENNPAVKEVIYVSQQEALIDFKDRHQNDEIILSSLDELDSNPLEATLNIKAYDHTRLAEIADMMKEKKYPIVDKINYYENQLMIDRLSSIIAGVRNTGLGVILVLAAIAVLVAFNTVRIAIWVAKEEISIMRLVGASGWYIRGPFLMEGLIHGALSGALASVLFYPALWVLSPKLLTIIPSINIYDYFRANFLQFIGILVGVGIFLGVFSSFIAIRKHLKV